MSLSVTRRHSAANIAANTAAATATTTAKLSREQATLVAPGHPPRQFVFGTSHARSTGLTLPALQLQSLQRQQPSTPIVAAHDLNAVYHRVAALKTNPRIQVEELGVVANHPIHALHFPALGCGDNPLRVLITAGVHGDEPCGVGAAMLLVEQLLAHPRMREDVAFTIVPVVNPRGYAANTRRTPSDVDLNRHFAGDNTSEEIAAIQELVSRRNFDLALDLHSGLPRRNGFWALHRGAQEILTPAFARFGEDWPILNGDTRPYTMSSPGVGTSNNQNTLKDYLYAQGVPWSVTLEAPGSLEYRNQVLGQNALVRHILHAARHAVQ